MAHESIPRTNTFVPAEWNRYFASLDPRLRSLGAADLCATVIERTVLESELVAKAVDAIRAGKCDPELLSQIDSLVQELESRYESLVGGDDGKLSSQDSLINDLFVKSRTATAIMFALQSKFTDMAMEAVHAIESEEQVLNLVRILDD